MRGIVLVESQRDSFGNADAIYSNKGNIYMYAFLRLLMSLKSYSVSVAMNLA